MLRLTGLYVSPVKVGQLVNFDRPPFQKNLYYLCQLSINFAIFFSYIFVTNQVILEIQGDGRVG